jgi:hypothetical protein
MFSLQLKKKNNMVTRTDIINKIITKYGFKSYLEIGVRVPSENFDKINVEFKESVDPNPKGNCNYIMTSDEFFEKHVGDKKYDIVFVDGLHTAEQSYKDVHNVMKHLTEGGFIVMHDCDPPSEFHIRPYEDYAKTGGQWNGDVFKAFITLKNELKDWSCFVIGEDWGCGILTKRKILENKGIGVLPKNFIWNDFNEKRKEYLQLTKYYEFTEYLGYPQYIITTQMTEHYYEISKPLFKSLKNNWNYRFIIGFIDFEPKNYDGEYYLMKKSDVKTYRTNFPENRINYVCPQAGEFIDYIPNISDNTIVIQIDSDTLMQRSFTENELSEIIPKDDQILSVYGANPPTNLYDVAKHNLSFKDPDKYIELNKYPEFTASIIIANKKTFIKLRDFYINEFDELISQCQHHAGGQWLINKIAYREFDVKILNSKFQCAEWYRTFNTIKTVDKKLLLEDEVVIFNHTKYLDEPEFKQFQETHIKSK